MTPQHLHLALHLRRDHQGTRALDKALHDGVNSDRCGNQQAATASRRGAVDSSLACLEFMLASHTARCCFVLVTSSTRRRAACTLVFALRATLYHLTSRLPVCRVPLTGPCPVHACPLPPSTVLPPSPSLLPSLPRCVLSQARGGATRWARWHDTNEKGLRWAVAGPAGTHTLPRRGNIRWARSREARESRSSSLHPADRRIYFERRGRRSGYGAPASAGVEAAPRRVSSTL